MTCQYPKQCAIMKNCIGGACSKPERPVMTDDTKLTEFPLDAGTFEYPANVAIRHAETSRKLVEMLRVCLACDLPPGVAAEVNKAIKSYEECRK